MASGQNIMMNPLPSDPYREGGNIVFAPQHQVVQTEITSVVITPPPNIIVAPRVYKNYMTLSIMTMLFCSLSFGIVALVYSCKTLEAHSDGDMDKEARSSQNAFKWNMAAIACGCVVHVIWTALEFSM